MFHTQFLLLFIDSIYLLYFHIRFHLLNHICLRGALLSEGKLSLDNQVRYGLLIDMVSGTHDA